MSTASTDCLICMSIQIQRVMCSVSGSRSFPSIRRGCGAALGYLVYRACSGLSWELQARGTVNFELDRGALGLSADAQATDAESGSVVSSAGQNFTVDIDKHSFRIVSVENQALHNGH